MAAGVCGQLMPARRTRAWLLGALAASAVAPVAQGGPIYSAVSGNINSGGPGAGTLTVTFNQAGLQTGYVSGVTDFDAYISGNPLHTMIFGGFEWFSNFGSNSASVTYDLGVSQTIDGMALWNEESSGIGLLDLLGSADGVNFAPLSLGLSPTDNIVVPSLLYPADVFRFAATAVRFVRLDMSRCPQPNPGTYPGCAIGEVAFRGADETVPEPASLALLGLGIAGLGLARRRRRA